MTPQPGPDAGPPAGTSPLTVRQAAPILGIEERSVRKRAAAGTLYAEPGEGGRLLVWVPDEAIEAHRRWTAGSHGGTGPGRVPAPSELGGLAVSVGQCVAEEVIAALRAELATTRDDCLARFAGQLDQLEPTLAELADQLKAKDRLIAELRLRAERAEDGWAVERRRTQTLLRAAEAEKARHLAIAPPAAPAREAGPPRYRWWDRWSDALLDRAEYPRTGFDRFLRRLLGEDES